MLGKDMARQARLIMILLAAVTMLPPSVSSAVLGGRIINSSDGRVDLFFSTTSNSFTDGVGGNPNVALEIYGTAAADVAGKYIAGVYAVGQNSSNMRFSVITADSVPPALGLTGAAGACPFDASLFCANTSFDVNFQANKAGTGDGAAFFPGNIYAMVSPDDNITFDAAEDILAPVVSPSAGSQISRSAPGGGNGSLRGSYSTNDVEATYDAATGNVSLNVIEAFGRTSLGSDVAISTTTVGDDDPFIQVGICSDVQGIFCNSTATVNISAPAVDMPTGLMNPADTATATLYSVVNGVGISFCVGPDLDVTDLTINGSSSFTLFPGGVVNLTATVSNVGNVNITQGFNVSFFDTGALLENRSIAALGSGQSTTVSMLYNTTGLLSGSRSITANVSDSLIGDCDDANDVSPARTLTITRVILPFIFIDAVETTVFARAGRVYNVTVQVNHSDGGTLGGAGIRIIERNGLSLFSPMQTFNYSAARTGLSPTSIGQVPANASGTAEFSLIPTGNPLYDPAFAVLNVSGHVGNYSLYLEIFNETTGGVFTLSFGGSIVTNITLTVANLTAQTPGSGEEDAQRVTHQTTFVQQMLEFIDQAFAAAFRRLDVI